LIIRSRQEKIERPERIISFTLPTPGSFLTGKSAMKAKIEVISGFKYVYASGLLKSAHTFARSLLGATPHDPVNFVFSNIDFLTLSPT
jgi:hypothetical protein